MCLFLLALGGVGLALFVSIWPPLREPKEAARIFSTVLLFCRTGVHFSFNGSLDCFELDTRPGVFF